MSSTPQFCLPLVLRKCLVDGRSGTLTFTRPGQTAPIGTLLISDGTVVFATSSERGPRPGERPDAYIIACVCALANLTDVSVRFEANDVSLPHTTPVALGRLILECLRASSDTERVLDWLGAPDELLGTALPPEQIFGKGALGGSEEYFVTHLDRPMTIDEMLDTASLDRGLAARLLCALRFAGCLVPAGAPKPWVGDSDSFVPSPPAVHRAEPARSAVDMDDVMRVCYLVEEKLRAVESGADFYALLETERRAPADRIKTQYRELAKTFHPDRHAQLADYASDIKSRLETVFGALTEAYTTLSHPKEREAYDQRLAKRENRVMAPASPSPAPPKAPVETPAATAAPQRSEPTPPQRKAQAAAPLRPPIPKPIVPPVPRAPSPPPAPATPPQQERPEPQPPRAPKAPQLPVETLYAHGASYADVGDFERAVQAFRRCVEIAPEDPRMHAALGGALASLHGLNRTAESLLRKAAELGSSSADLFVEIGRIYQRYDRPQEARTLFKRAALLDPGNEEARDALGSDAPLDSANGFFRRLFSRR